MLIRSRAPLRLGFAGGGTDVVPYCDTYGGYILNVTIGLFAYCVIEPTNNGKIEFLATDFNQFECFDATQEITPKGDFLLHKGAYNRVVKEYNAGKPLSFKMTTYSDAPPGSGLGTSSTMMVAILKAMLHWLQVRMDEYDLAKLAFDVERIDLGLAGGRQDQYATVFGGLNFIEFHPDKVIVNPLRIHSWIRYELESSLLLYFTGVSRSSAKIINDQTKAIESESSLLAMHKVKEEALVMKESLLKGKFDEFYTAFQRSWDAKKNTSSSVSNSHIDDVLELAFSNGARAAKVSGAGGGGFIMLFSKPSSRQKLADLLSRQGGQVFKVLFCDHGAKSWDV